MRPLSGRRTPSTHSIVVVLPGAVGTDEAEDLSLADLERHVVDGDGRAIFLPDPRDLDDSQAAASPPGPDQRILPDVPALGPAGGQAQVDRGFEQASGHRENRGLQARPVRPAATPNSPSVAAHRPFFFRNSRWA